MVLSSARCNALLSWYGEHARCLPWRETDDPYHIWISEIMLQQTQVKTVLPRYAIWFERFPDIAALAKADLNDVLKVWEGLGYYRRARFIHNAAQQISNLHGGIFPRDFNAIMALPGIGRSTAKRFDCDHCPVNKHCESAFQVEVAKESRKSITVRNVHWRVDLHIDREKGIWLTQRPASGIWASLWTPPITELPEAPENKPDHIHLLTHRRLHLYSQTSSEKPTGDGVWVNDLATHALPTGIHHLLATIDHASQQT